MTASRPELLPFALPKTIGLPHHGKVQNSLLTLPSTATMAYTQPSDGGCVVIQHSLHSAPSRSAKEAAHDTANDRVWQEYALLSGYRHQIGGQELGEEYHPYCDAKYAWKIRIKLTQGTGSATVDVYLCGPFGLFSDADLTMTDRLLATKTWSPVDQNGNTMPASTLGRYAMRTFSKTGSKALLMVGTSYSTSIQNAGLLRVITQHQPIANLYVHDIIRVSITGNGSIVPGLIGNGISASIDQESIFPWYTFTSASLGTFPSDPYGTTQTTTWKYLVVLTPDGDEVELTRTQTTTFIAQNLQWEGGIEFSELIGADVEQETTETMAFGARSLESSAVYAGTYDANQSPDNFGTVTTNGVAAAWDDDAGAPDAPSTAFLAAIGFANNLPLASYIERTNLSPVVLFADRASQSAATGIAEHYFAYDPGSGTFATATGAVSFV